MLGYYKIKKDWMEPPLSYRFRASIRVNTKDEWKIIVFDRNSNKINNIKNSRYYLLTITPQNQPIVNEIESLVDQILALKNTSSLQDTPLKEENL